MFAYMFVKKGVKSVPPEYNSATVCKNGFKCPLGTSNMKLCEPGYYQPTNKTIFCYMCKIGTYCPGTLGSTEYPFACDAG
jgi:hypothetical protein